MDKLSRDLLAMSSSPANYTRLRTIPVVTSMVQLLHQTTNIRDASSSSLVYNDKPNYSLGHRMCNEELTLCHVLIRYTVILYYSKQGDNLTNGQSREIKLRISRSLHNMVHTQPSDKHYKKEGKVLRLLENLRMYADILRDVILALNDLDDELNESNQYNEATESMRVERLENEEAKNISIIQEKERIVTLLDNCNPIKVATIMNPDSPSGKDLMILCSK